MAERICQNSKLEKGRTLSVLVENVLPDMIIVSLKCGLKCFRGALFNSNKENVCYGIGVKRKNIVDKFKSAKSPTTVIVQPEVPSEDSSACSSLCNRYSYALDTEAVDSSLVNNSRKPFTRPLINRSLNRMRLRARQVVCSVCKKGIHEKKEVPKDASKALVLRSDTQQKPNILSPFPVDKRPNSGDKKTHDKKPDLKKIPGDLKSGNGSDRKFTISEKKTVTSDKKSTNDSKKIDKKASCDTKKRKTLSDLMEDRAHSVITKRQKVAVKSSPAIKISFASPKGVGTVLKIPPRPSTPIPSDSDLSQDNTSEPVHDPTPPPPRPPPPPTLYETRERSTRRLKAKKNVAKSNLDRSTSKRSKHSKHKSKKKAKRAVLKDKSLSSGNKVTLPVRSPIGYRFVTRSSPGRVASMTSPQQKSPLSPESMNCKVVLEKLDNQKIASRGYLSRDANSRRNSCDDVTDFDIVEAGKTISTEQDRSDVGENRLTKNSEQKVVPIPDQKLVEDSGKDQSAPTAVGGATSKCDYQQYFEDISDSDSNPLTVDLGEDQVPGMSERLPEVTERLPPMADAINDENRAPPRPHIKMHIQTRQVAKCELPDGRVLRVGDVVWGKIVGFPWWPGRVTLLLESLKDFGTIIAQNAHVNWFGSSTMSVMNCADLYPFLEHYKEKYSKKKKGSYKRAIKQANLVAQTLVTSQAEAIVHPPRLAPDVTSGDSQSSLAPSENQSSLAASDNVSDDEERLYIALDEPIGVSRGQCRKQPWKALDSMEPEVGPEVGHATALNKTENTFDGHQQEKVEFDGLNQKHKDIISGYLSHCDDHSKQTPLSCHLAETHAVFGGKKPSQTSWSRSSPSESGSQNVKAPSDSGNPKMDVKTPSYSHNTNEQSMHLDLPKSEFDVQTVPNSDPVLSSTIRDSSNCQVFDEGPSVVDDSFSDKLVIKDEFKDERIFEAISDLEEGEIVDSSAEES